MAASKRSTAFIIAFSAFLMVVVFLFGALHFLPTYIETRVLPELALNSGVTAYELNIRRLGLNGADLGPIRFGSSVNPALTIDNVQIDYGIRGLRRRHIDRIAISGLKIYLTVSNDRLLLREFELTPILERFREQKDDVPPPTAAGDPITIGDIIINNAAAEVEYNGRIIRLPFSTEIRHEKKDGGTLGISGRIFPPLTQIDVNAQWKIGANRLHLMVNSAEVPVKPLIEGISSAGAIRAAGQATLIGDLQCQLNPFKVEKLAASLTLDRAQIGYDVSEHVVRYNYVKPFRILHHPHANRVHVTIIRRHIGIFGLYLVKSSLP